MSGVFQVDREIFHHDIWQDPVKFRIFFYILGQAVFKEEGITVAGIKLERGQYLRSLRKLQEDLMYKEGRGNAIKKYPVTTLQNKIKSLVNEGQITVKSTESGTVFTVVNYAVYQGFERFDKSEVEQLSNSNGTAIEQRPNKKNNVNKDMNDKKKDTRKQVYEESSIPFQLSKYFFERIKINNPDHKQPNFQTWSNDIRLMMEKDNRTEAQIKYLMKWVQEDDFEMTNVLSPSKLRKRYDQLVLKVKSQKQKKQPSKPSREDFDLSD